MKYPKGRKGAVAADEFFVTGRKIVRYDGKICHLSCRRYYCKIRTFENGAFTLVYRGSGDHEEYRRLKDKIEILADAPETVLADLDFWTGFFRDFTG